jgi:NADPH-dependent glutamate synthase beta subunit-like oxidoreductase
VHFVPRTAIGRDLGFADLLRSWGFDLVVLANGAWRDRPLPVDGAEAYVGRGLVYQNPLIYWFNHQHEPSYSGPRYAVPDGALVVGGGLASIDVVKVLQLVTTRDALAARGIEQDLLAMEAMGIPETLARHGLEWQDLGLAGCTLVYRRRIDDMPLTEPAPGRPEDAAKSALVRRKILEKAQSKFLFRVEQLAAPVGLLVEGDRLAGLRFARTRIDAAGRAEIVPGDEFELRAPLVVSSIGSIPEPIEGLAMRGELLRIEDHERGKIADFEQVFGCGNVITGKGNLVASRRHSGQVASHLVEHRLNGGERQQESSAALLARVRERQRSVGFDGDYRSWIERVRPEGFA